MNVLVAGGAGYIGSNLVDMLRQAGHNVRVLDLQPTGSERLADPGCGCVRGNTTDPGLVTQVVQRVVGTARPYDRESRSPKKRPSTRLGFSSHS
jgi:nucleoside-diphosphate-sugar epimerase